MSEILSALTTATSSGSITTQTAFAYVLLSGLLGVFIALTYMKTTDRFSTNFARTLVVLPMLVSVIIIMVNGNLGTSVAILGSFGLIRFRSMQGTSKDISYIFFTMVIGLCTSMGYLGFSVAITAFVCLVYWVLYISKFGEKKGVFKDLRITIPENLDYAHIFDDLFEVYTSSHSLYKVKTTNMGSLYELSYRIREIEEEKEKEFLDAIRTRNGNLTVVCGQVAMAEEL